MNNGRVKDLNRRQFLKQSCGTVSAITFMTLITKCGDDSSADSSVGFSIDLTDAANSALGAIGGSIVRNGIVVIRISSDEYVALSGKCTHQGCTVSYSSATGQLACPCHGSRFDASGEVLQGPATTSLPSYSVAVSGNILTVDPNVLV